MVTLKIMCPQGRLAMAITDQTLSSSAAALCCTGSKSNHGCQGD